MNNKLKTNSKKMNYLKALEQEETKNTLNKKKQIKEDTANIMAIVDNTDLTTEQAEHEYAIHGVDALNIIMTR